MLNNVADKASPCPTPKTMSKESLTDPPILTFAVAFSRVVPISFIILSGTPFLTSALIMADLYRLSNVC
jgi:hypothetical protein